MGANWSFATVWGIEFLGFYPYKACLCLINLGYDPFPLTIGYPFFDRRQTYYFPNLFSYASWLQLLVGFSGCFKGATTWLAYNFIYYHVEKHCKRFLDKYMWPTVYDPNIEVRTREIASFTEFLKDIIRSAVETIIITTTTRPFVVVMIRQIAQIIGDENKYTSILQAISLIYSEEGCPGLFRGLHSAIVCNIIYNTGWSLVIYLVAKLIVRFKLNEHFGEESTFQNMIRLRTFISIIPWYFVFQTTYPLYVVGQIKAVEGSGLRAASPPFMPKFTTSFWNPFNETEDRRKAFFIRRQFLLPGNIELQADGKPYLQILR